MNRRQRRRRAMMVRIVALAPLVAGVVSWGIGLALGPVHQERTSKSYSSSPEAVWAALVDLDGMPGWRRDLAKVERLPVENGAARWLEIGVRGRRSVLERVESVPQHRMTVVAARGDHLGFRWTYQLAPDGNGTRLEVVEERTVRNPAIRAIVRMLGSDRGLIEGVTRDLEARLAGHRQGIAAALP